jgi:hypothetical protein
MFPANALPPSDYEPYFKPVRQACLKMVNFFNQFDNAVGTPVLRSGTNLPVDNWLGHLAGNVYDPNNCVQIAYYGGWWRVDQCRKTVGPLLDVPANADFLPSIPRPVPIEKFYRYWDAESGTVKGDVYRDNVLDRELQVVPYPAPGTPEADDKFRALAFGTQSYSATLGATGEMVNPGVLFDEEHDLKESAFFNLPTPESAVRHIYHSGQFRSFLGNSDHSRRGFWFQLLSDLKQSASTPRK